MVVVVAEKSRHLADDHEGRNPKWLSSAKVDRWNHSSYIPAKFLPCPLVLIVVVVKVKVGRRFHFGSLAPDKGDDFSILGCGEAVRCQAQPFRVDCFQPVSLPQLPSSFRSSSISAILSACCARPRPSLVASQPSFHLCPLVHSLVPVTMLRSPYNCRHAGRHPFSQN